MKFLERFFGPPSEAKFAKLLIETFRRIGDEGTYHHDEAERRLILTKNGEQAGIVNLTNLYATYVGLPKAEREAFIANVCIGLAGRTDVPTDFEDVKPDLRPTVRSKFMTELMRLSAAAEGGKYLHLPSIPLSDHLAVSLVYDLPKAMRFVTQDNLDEWGVTLYEAMEVARQSLHEFQPAQYASVGDRLYIFENADAYDGTRMLLLDLMRSLKVEGRPLALPMTRDCLIVTGSDDIEGQRMMVDLAEQLIESPRPLCSVAHVLDGDEWEPWSPPDDNPLVDKFRRLAMQYFGVEYAEQQGLLEKLAAQHRHDVFVATYHGMQQEGAHFSYCVWTKGCPSWLPKTDLIAFVDPETEAMNMIPWQRVVQAAGDMLEELEHYPPRWSVTDFPTAEQLAAMAQSKS